MENIFAERHGLRNEAGEGPGLSSNESCIRSACTYGLGAKRKTLGHARGREYSPAVFIERYFAFIRSSYKRIH